MPRVLIISPHFPPDTSAASHRFRLLAPHLAAYNWIPTILTVEPKYYESRLDAGLEAMTVKGLDVVRTPAFSAIWTRWFGIGDLGIRSLAGLYRGAIKCLSREKHDAICITIYPTYTALLGPLLKRRFQIPFVLDYQDPWIGSWGKTVGSGAGGRVDAKSWVTRRIAQVLEPIVIRSVDALTAVSEGTLDGVLERNPLAREVPRLALPLGGESADLSRGDAAHVENRYFDPADGLCHICYVGTIWPAVSESLQALLTALLALKKDYPADYQRIRLHFFGSSNQSTVNVRSSVMPLAEQIGVADGVQEIPQRIPYFEAMKVQQEATALLMIGGVEPHYSPSKLYPLILSKRPILSILHRLSEAAEIFQQCLKPPTGVLVGFDDATRAEKAMPQILTELRRLVHNPIYRPEDVDWSYFSRYESRNLAGRFGALLDDLAARRLGRGRVERKAFAGDRGKELEQISRNGAISARNAAIFGKMHRVLLISPHFPPDTSAATHRFRLLAPHLREFGWEPTVLTVAPEGYEERLDATLQTLVPKDLRIVRVGVWSPNRTRAFGFGDLGLRSLTGIWSAASKLLREEEFDLVCVSIYPSYTATVAILLKRRFKVPIVLDYQDPWVGAWGRTVGGGANNAVDFKSRVTRWVSLLLEPITLRSVDGITAVSEGTYDEVLARNPRIYRRPFASIPVGGEKADFEAVRRCPVPNRFFKANDGLFHLCYVGTILPLGYESLKAFLAAVRQLKDSDPLAYARLRLHFFGTSNQTNRKVLPCVLPLARRVNVDDCVEEEPSRIDYAEALTVQVQAGGILLLGSSERHYTASKIFPAIQAGRPILAIFHEASSVVDILRRSVPDRANRLVTYSDSDRAESRSSEIYAHLRALIQNPECGEKPADNEGLEEFSARTLSGRMAGLFDEVLRASSTQPGTSVERAWSPRQG